jgi:RNA polymerase sigma-70 factor (ECF subfamily)
MDDACTPPSSAPAASGQAASHLLTSPAWRGRSRRIWRGHPPGCPATTVDLTPSASATAPTLADRDAAPAGLAEARAQRDRQLAAWLSGAANGRADDFERFYDATIALAQAFGHRLLRGADLDDVLAEAYLQVWRECASYRCERGSPVSWLLCIVRNRAIDLLRHRQASPECAEDDETERECERRASDDAGPPDLLEATRRCSELHAALADLSAQERWLLGLAYFRDFTHAQISETTGLPLGTVKSCILRAQAKLRDVLLAAHPAVPLPRPTPDLQP